MSKSKTTEQALPSAGAILCIGNPLLDISFQGDKQFVKEQGLEPNGALVLETARFEQIRQALFARYKDMDLVPGGGCQNAARTVQWLLGKYPGTVTYMGAVGKDKNGAILTQKAKDTGINVVYQTVNDGTSTGCCLVIVNDKHRSMVANIGAAAHFTLEHVKSNWAAVESAKLVYVEGFFLPYCFEAAMTVARHVSEHPDKRFLLNLSAEYLTTVYKHLLIEIMPYVDVLIGNSAEAHSLAKTLGLPADCSFEQIAKSISSLEKKRGDLKRIVIITRGAESVVIASSPDTAFSMKVRPVSSEKIVDTTGAGDSFVGGVLAQMIRGNKTLAQMIQSGLNTAEIVIQQLGCTFPSVRPDLDKLCEQL